LQLADKPLKNQSSGRSLSENSIQEMLRSPYHHISDTYPKSQGMAMCLFFGGTLVNHTLCDMVFEWGISFRVLWFKGLLKTKRYSPFPFFTTFSLHIGQSKPI